MGASTSETLFFLWVRHKKKGKKAKDGFLGALSNHKSLVAFNVSSAEYHHFQHPKNAGLAQQLTSLFSADEWKLPIYTNSKLFFFTKLSFIAIDFLVLQPILDLPSASYMFIFSAVPLPSSSLLSPQVDGVSLQGCSEQRAMEVLRRTGPLVRLRLLRKAVCLSHILPPVPPLQPLRHSHSFHEGNPYRVGLNRIQETGAPGPRDGAACWLILL